MEYLEILNRLWYLFLFPVVYFIVKEDKEVPLLFSFLIFCNHFVFDYVGVSAESWFFTQALFSGVFWYFCLFISHPLLRKAARLVCLYVVFVNLFEQYSKYPTIFYDWWEVINWVALDLIAACIILNNKLMVKARNNVEPV